MITIDGSRGEGGGQILRTSLALALWTRRPLRLENIRAGRPKPGLARQHLTAVRAAAAVGDAEVEGEELGSQSLRFTPRRLRAGGHRFSTDGAGSTTLVLQTVLLPLLAADAPSHLVLEGGTHNPFAPPFEFLDRAFLPLLRRMGADVELGLERHGFHPAGGGRLRGRIRPSRLEPLELPERGELVAIRARALVSKLPRQIGERELETVGRKLGIAARQLELVEVPRPRGPGNAVMVEVECERATELFTGFGRRGVPAEEVAGEVAREAREYLESGVPVGRHLQDQLLLPLALAGGAGFRTVEPTAHTRTNLEVIGRFLEKVGWSVVPEPRPGSEGAWRVEVTSTA